VVRSFSVIAEDEFGLGELEGGVEFSTLAALDAVDGPEGLRAVGEIDLLVGFVAGVGGGERGMVEGVPVLGEDDVVEDGSEAVDGGEDGIAIGDGQCAAGAEVALHVDDEEDVVGGDVHGSLPGAGRVGRYQAHRSQI